MFFVEEKNSRAALKPAGKGDPRRAAGLIAGLEWV